MRPVVCETAWLHTIPTQNVVPGLPTFSLFLHAANLSAQEQDRRDFDSSANGPVVSRRNVERPPSRVVTTCGHHGSLNVMIGAMADKTGHGRGMLSRVTMYRARFGWKSPGRRTACQSALPVKPLGNFFTDGAHQSIHKYPGIKKFMHSRPSPPRFIHPIRRLVLTLHFRANYQREYLSKSWTTDSDNALRASQNQT